MKTKLWGILLIVSCAFAQENYSSWSHYKVIAVNTTGDTVNGGANVIASVANFPVLVRLTAAQTDVFSGATANGTDIRFTASNGAQRLKHQRERWDAVNHVAEFWVLVPVIAGNALTTFRMYWGKTGAADSSNGAAVFDTANGYRAVWHMNGTGDETDATVNNLTATNTGVPTSNASGAVGPARTFNGTSQYFTLLNSANGILNFHLTDNFTISEWVNIASVPPGRNAGLAIINKGDNQWNMEAQDTSNLNKSWQVEVRANNTFLYARSDGTPAITANSGIGVWHHLMGTFRGAAMGQAIAETLYYDGNPVRTLSATYTNNTGRNENFNVFIGALGGGTAPGATITRYWPGSLDELSVSKTVRSKDWAKLSYQTQKSGVNAVTLGATLVPTAIRFPISHGSFSIRTQSVGSSVIFLFPKQTSAVQVSVRDVSGQRVWKGKADAGATQLTWDQKVNGLPIKAGVFFIQMALDAGGKSTSLAELKITLPR